MATGMSWQQQQNYYSGGASVGAAKFMPSSPGVMAHQASLSMEYTAELHLKMSKKIAQLTKVIYALNTKNDEHESGIQAIKEAHEEEIQKILAETHEKILLFKNKVSEETDLKHKVKALEESLEEHKKMKHQALTEFEVYKHRVEDMQLCAEAQHVQRVVTMSREVEEMRKKFDERIRNFMQIQIQFEKDKRSALDELRTSRLEIQELLKAQHNQNATLNKGQETLAEMHLLQIEDLNKKMEDMRLERKILVEEYEAKFTKAQAFYEHEVEALKRSQMFTAESLHTCKQKEAELKRDFQSQEALLQKNLGILKTEFQVVQEEAGNLREKGQKLQASLNTAETNIQVLQKQLENVKQGEMSLLSKHNDMESELAAARERIQQQATELVLKASHIGMLQTTQMTQEATIQDLESEKARIKEKITRLEEERSLLQSKNQNLDERQRQQILALEKKISEAKQTHRQCYEKELMNLRIKFEEETVQLKEFHAKIVEEMSLKHQAALEAAQNTANNEKKKLQIELQQQFEKELSELEESNNQLRQQLGNLKEELTERLTTANLENVQLQDLVTKSKQGLGSAECHITSLKDTQDRLQKELDVTSERLRETNNSLFAVQGQLEKEKQQHEAILSAMREEERLKMDKVARDLELKWTETLRQECSKLREELKLQHAEDKKSAIAQLLQIKEREMNTAKDGWQKKVEDLLDQISLLKQNLEMQICQSQSALQHLQSQFSSERQRLTRELHELEEEHQQRQTSLQEAHIIAFQTMEDAKAQKQKDLEERLHQKYSEELQSVKDAHKQVMDVLRLEMEQELQTLRFELEDEGKAMLASLRSELNHQHAAAIDLLRNNHQLEMDAATINLERHKEINRRQECELLGQITDLQDKMRHQEQHASELNKQLVALKENMNSLTKELDFKGKEILCVRSEANQQIRLTEMEEKYQNRESRPEDLQIISELKDMVTERDQLIKKLIDDKKFYQLELVNRETNFNKVFSASPNVGVINPLVKQKKKNDKSTNRFVSVPNLSALESGGMGNGHPTRLEPIPNSPIHDIEFNGSKPLPQPVPPKEVKTLMSPPQTETSPVASPDPQRQEWFARYFTF
ncbi:family with sequence similarity 184 member A L homeolog isoform X3 [Xenopus laevis]|uniref:Family with sequence similarity 184 member A L homeolog isoform X3 n=1 Tax=Xenopus laevis TaxID=8355 RepID=A0A8J1KLK2_XENLA|nr:family with sequence similarity 184 member A L homeolog isoform X3 [Xenopus laevis]